MLICGYNVGVFKNIFKRIAFTIYAFTIIGVVSYSTMTCCPSQEISFIWQLIEYDVFVVIMLFSKSNFYNSFHQASYLDTCLRLNRRHYFLMRRKIVVIVISIWLLGVGHAITHCFLHGCYSYLGKFIIYELSLLALDINRVWRYSLFEEVWRRLKLLRMRLEENREDYYLYVKDHRTVKEDKLKFGLNLYKCIADFLDMITPELNASVSLSVCLSIGFVFYLFVSIVVCILTAR